MSTVERPSPRSKSNPRKPKKPKERTVFADGRKTHDTVGGYLGALSSGALNIPIDASRYSQHLWNAASDKSDQEISDEHAAITKSHDNPAIFSDEFNEKRSELAEQYPVTTAGGEVLATGLGAGALIKGGVNLAKGGAKKIYKNILKGDSIDSPVKFVGKAMGGAAVGEAVKEPIYDELIAADSKPDPVNQLAKMEVGPIKRKKRKKKREEDQVS
jgi:hypothetical protein